MQVTVTWEALAAICGLITMLAVGNIFIIRAVVRDEIKKINGTYIRADGSMINGYDIERRLDDLETRVFRKA